MSRTTRESRGKTVRQFGEYREKASRTKDKFMGWTSGQHSKRSGNTSDKTPVNGKDFVKYGYPVDFRSKKEKEFEKIEKSLDKEIEDVKIDRNGK